MTREKINSNDLNLSHVGRFAAQSRYRMVDGHEMEGAGIGLIAQVSHRFEPADPARLITVITLDLGAAMVDYTLRSEFLTVSDSIEEARYDQEKVDNE